MWWKYVVVNKVNMKTKIICFSFLSRFVDEASNSLVRYFIRRLLFIKTKCKNETQTWKSIGFTVRWNSLRRYWTTSTENHSGLFLVSICLLFWCCSFFRRHRFRSTTDRSTLKMWHYEKHKTWFIPFLFRNRKSSPLAFWQFVLHKNE